MAQFSFFSFQKSFILSFRTTKTRHHHLTHRISSTLRTKPTENYFLPLQLGCKNIGLSMLYTFIYRIFDQTTGISNKTMKINELDRLNVNEY